MSIKKDITVPSPQRNRIGGAGACATFTVHVCRWLQKNCFEEVLATVWTACQSVVLLSTHYSRTNHVIMGYGNIPEYQNPNLDPSPNPRKRPKSALEHET